MVYIVTSVFNRKEITLRFVSSLQQQTVQNFTVIVVDDGSTDGVSDVLAKQYPEVVVLSGDGNLWWTGAMAKGVEYVKTVAKAGDYIVMANNDHLHEPDALEQCLKASQDNLDDKGRGAIVASVVKDATTKQVVTSAQTIDWSSVQYQPIPNGEIGYYNGAIDVMPGRFTLFPAEAFDVITLEPKVLPHYLADYDLSLQAKRAGFSLVVNYEAVIYDEGGVSGIAKLNNRPTVPQVWNTMFSIRSHGNIVYLSRYIIRNCPSIVYTIKHLVGLAGLNLFRLLKAVVLLRW